MKITDRLRSAYAGFTEGNISVIQRLDEADSRPSISGWGAMFSSAYNACEQVKARTLGSLPIAVYEKKNGLRNKQDGHPLTRLLAGWANEFETGTELRQWVSIRRDTFGFAQIFIDWQDGVPIALYPVTGTSRPDYDVSRKREYRMQWQISSDKRIPDGSYYPWEIVTIKTPISKDGGMTGESLAKYAAESIGLSIDTEAYYSKMLNDGNHVSGHVEMPEGAKPDEKLSNAISNALEGKKGVAGIGKTPIFWGGAKFVKNSQTMKEASLVEQETWILQQVCRFVSMPPQKVGDLSRSTYTNSEQTRIEYATDTVAPDATSFEKAFQIVLDRMGDVDCYLHFDLNGLMKGDKATQSEWYKTMRYIGAMSADEIREKEDMNPIPNGGGKGYLIPANYAVIEDGEVKLLTNGSEPAIGSPQNIHPLVADAIDRIRARYEKDGDTEKTRQYARTVLAPFKLTAAEMRVQFDSEIALERIFDGFQNRK